MSILVTGTNNINPILIDLSIQHTAHSTTMFAEVKGAIAAIHTLSSPGLVMFPGVCGVWRVEGSSGPKQRTGENPCIFDG